MFAGIRSAGAQSMLLYNQTDFFSAKHRREGRLADRHGTTMTGRVAGVSLFLLSFCSLAALLLLSVFVASYIEFAETVRI